MKLSECEEKQEVRATVFSSETDLVLNPQVCLIFCHSQLYYFNPLIFKWTWSTSPWD